MSWLSLSLKSSGGTGASERVMCRGGRSAAPRTFLCSFSAVSKRIFATKYAFCSIFQNLQNLLADFSKNSQKFANLPKDVKLFEKFCNLLAEICQICSRDDFLVDFEKCCKMRIWTRKSASIQKRKSPPKFFNFI